MQTLRSILAVYHLERDVQQTTIDHLGYAIGRYAKFLGREPDIDDLNDETMNRFLLWMAEHGARCTMRNYRVRLLTIWRFGVEIGLLDRLPLRVRKVRLTHPAPEAWSVEQVEKLLRHVATIRGRFKFAKVIRRHYWRAVIRTAYDTGLRFGDLMELRLSNIADQGIVVVRQHKTGVPIVRWIHPETWQAIEKIADDSRPRIFGDVLGRRSFFERFSEISKAAGVNGKFRWLRRSGASLVERDDRGAGKLFLGHKSHGIAERHYFDPRMLASAPILPPRLTG